MADVTYQVIWETEPADKAGVKKEDLPKGLQSAGKQREFIKSSDEGRAIFQALKGMNYDIVDVQDEPVYRVKEKGKTKYWVPYGQWYQATGAIGTHTHYALARVEKVAPSADELQADLEQHKADQLAELERHKAEQQAQLEQMRGDMELQKAKLQGELEIQKMRREMDEMKAQAAGVPAPGSSPAGMPAGSGSLRTFEIYGMVNGQRVPLSQVAINQGGRYSQMPGSRILIGDSPGDGYGLSGVPGAWASLYPGQSPANYGLDADKGVLGHDGTRAWVLPATFLTQLFGPSWRQQVYG